MHVSVLIYSTILAFVILLVDVVWGVSVNIGNIRSFRFPYTSVQSNLEHLQRNLSGIFMGLFMHFYFY